MYAAIVAAGEFPRKDFPLYMLGSADMIVCCDGALSTLKRKGIEPAVVIGDMDSASRKALKEFKGKVVKVDEQETNDLSKAFRYIMENCPDVDTIRIFGATGRSEAHTLGNMSLLMEYEKDWNLSERGIIVEMISDYSTIFAIGDSCELHIGQGRRISIFTPDRELTINSTGLTWPTDNVVFDNWWKATLNIASEDVVALKLSHPSQVLIVLD